MLPKVVKGKRAGPVDGQDTSTGDHDKKRRGKTVHGHWCSTERYSGPLGALGSDGIVTSRAKQKTELGRLYRWIMEVERPEGVLEDPDMLAQNVAGIEKKHFSWRLELHAEGIKLKDGWVPWLMVRPDNTNTGYRVFALREFRKGELVGWLFGKSASPAEASKYRKHNVDAEGTTGFFAGMGLHLVASPTWGLEDPRHIRRVKGLANVQYENDGAVIARKNIPMEEELLGDLAHMEPNV